MRNESLREKVEKANALRSCTAAKLMLTASACLKKGTTCHCKLLERHDTRATARECKRIVEKAARHCQNREKEELKEALKDFRVVSKKIIKILAC